MSPVASAPGADELTETEVVDRLRLAVTRLARQLRRQASEDLTPTMLSALATIARRQPLTLGELATIEGVAPPTITSVVGRLEGRLLVVRTPDQHDRRVCRVETSAEGRRLLDRIRRRRTAWLATRVADLEPDEAARLAAAIEVLEHLTEGDRP